MRPHKTDLLIIRTALVSLVLGLGLVPMVAAPVAAAVSTPCVDSAGDEAAAVAAAKACGGEVEVGPLTSETLRAVAEPSGQIKWTQSTASVRVRRNGGWVPVDTSLRLVGGSPMPVASTVDVRFSRGGTDPLITVKDGPSAVSMSWPGVLPTPVLQGDSAVYREVLTGVDLRVRATADGFTHVLVVKDAVAAKNPALRSVKYRWSGGGLSIRSAPDGTVEVVNGLGGVFLKSAPASMWDSATMPASFDTQALSATGAKAVAAVPDVSTAKIAGDAARVGGVTASASAAEVVVTPDLVMLSESASLTYPLYIDPSFGLTRQQWAWMSSYLANTNDAHGRAGNNPDGYGIFRSLFQFEISPLKGRTIYDAKFNTVLYHSSSCDDTPVSLWKGHDIASGVSNGTRTTWRDDELITHLEEKYAHANKGGGCARPADPDVPMEFSGGLASQLQYQADQPGWTWITLVLSTANWNRQGESNTSWWKKFWWDQTSVTAWTNAFPGTPTVQAHNTTTDCYKVCIQQPKITSTNAETRTDGWWRLDGPSGSVTSDSSQRALHAQIYGPVTWSDGAANFAGNADLAVVAGGPVLDTSQSYSVSFWAKTGSGGWECAVSQDGASQSGFLIVMHPNGQTWEMHNYSVDGSSPDAWVQANTAATPGQWAHVVGIYDRAAGTMRLHVNGSTAAEGGANTGFSATGPFVIGRCKFGGAGANQFDGSIDNVQTYQRVLSASEASQLYTAGRAGGAPGASPAIVRTATPELKVSVSDPDGGLVDAEYEVRSAAAATASLVDSGIVLDRSSGTTAAWKVSAGKLAANTTYYWRARARDEANWYSGWTAWQGVTVDTTQPAVPTSPSTQYPQKQWGAVVGTTGTFTLTDTSPDTAEFEWWVDSEPRTTTAATGTSSRTASVTWPALTDMVHTMHVIAKDVAGNTRQNTDYQFWVKPSAYASRCWLWKLDETAGPTAADSGKAECTPADNTVAPANGTVAGGVTFGTGKLANAATLNGSTGQITSSGAVLDTTKEFTVMAWVKLDSTSSLVYQTAVTQDGTNVSGFHLMYNKDANGGTGGWCFLMRSADSNTANITTACTTGAVAKDQWVHLAGVRDKNAGTIRVYVMGDPDACTGEVASAAYTGSWAANGPFAIGRGRYNAAATDYWQGGIDDVRAYQRVLTASEICQQADQ